MTIAIEPLRATLGTKVEDEDVVTRAPLKAMIATFDRPDKVPEEGEPIAPGWHLCFLHSYARPAQLARDGAAFTGGVLPTIPMPRRIKSITVCARAPLFDTAPLDVIGRPTADGTGAELWTVTPKGTIAAQATATLA